MRCWSSKPQSLTVKNLDSVNYCFVSSLALTSLPIPAISTTQVHPSIWASPVYVLEYPTATRGHLPTSESLVSVPSYRLPTPTSSPFRLRSYYIHTSPPILLLLLAFRESARVAGSFFAASWRHHAFLLRPPLAYPVSLAHTSNKGHSATHCARVICHCSM